MNDNANSENVLGDLWDGNVQIDVDTKQPVMFDSCTFYGHNESQHSVSSVLSMGK